jgi:hypothetical protein
MKILIVLIKTPGQKSLNLFKAIKPMKLLKSFSIKVELKKKKKKKKKSYSHNSLSIYF